MISKESRQLFFKAIDKPIFGYSKMVCVKFHTVAIIICPKQFWGGLAIGNQNIILYTCIAWQGVHACKSDKQTSQGKTHS